LCNLDSTRILRIRSIRALAGARKSGHPTGWIVHHGGDRFRQVPTMWVAKQSPVGFVKRGPTGRESRRIGFLLLVF